MPLRVGHAVGRQRVHRRHLAPASVGRPGRTVSVVIENDEDIRGGFRCLVGKKRVPVRLRVVDVELDSAVELLRHATPPEKSELRFTFITRLIITTPAQAILLLTSPWTPSVPTKA